MNKHPSMNFIDYIHQQLHEKKAYPFVDFMQDALYAPNIGYYTGGSPVLGKEGDFITAPELTPLFGQALANQCAPVLREMTHPILFEFGAGSGRLCVDSLKHLRTLDCLPDEYHILELSGHLKARQQALIQHELPELFERVQWLSSWPKTPFQGIVLANEVLDAMPVHRFLQTNTGLMESYVSLNTENQLQETFKPCTNDKLIAYVHDVLPQGQLPYLSEVNLLLEDWLQPCYEMLERGLVLLIDYGFPRHEYYHPDRNQGTLMCHYRHQAHTNPLAHPGEQDITAHVDFTQVAFCADKAGFHVAGYTNQAAFLLANGILELAQQDGGAPLQSALKQLIQPNEMGELFKVIALTKQFDKPLSGFQFNDKRGSL
jgi:SAM-dependent MidA family methyltransferase